MSKLRTTLERLSRGRYLKRRLPSRFKYTPFYVSPDAALRYLRPGTAVFDELLEIIDDHISEDSTVWDIGANVGVFSFGAASVAKKGSVIAVEPDIWLAQLMRKSLSLKENKGLSIQILPCAISNVTGIATFIIVNSGRSSNFLEAVHGSSQTDGFLGGIREKVTVPTLTLDILLDFVNPPSFVKIDVEGAELMVLNGARKILAEIRPTIYTEVCSDVSKEITSIFHQNSYVLFDGTKRIQEQKPIDVCVWNTLAVPQEKI